jgi:hypothetical protein
LTLQLNLTIDGYLKKPREKQGKLSTKEAHVLSILDHCWTDYRLADRKIGQGRRIRADPEHRYGVAGALAGGFVALPASAPNYGGLVYTNVAAILGTVVVTGINACASERKRYA